MNQLNSYVLKIEGFSSMLSSKKVAIFTYFLTTELGFDGVTPKDIEECFHILHLHPYSNIRTYLLSKTKGKEKIFLRYKTGKYGLERDSAQKIASLIGSPPLPSPEHSTFLPFEIFKDSRNYVQKIAEQVITSYDVGLYDACSVMIRKLCEVLIIECFERHDIVASIKKQDDSFLYLNDLVTELLAQKKWNLGRNARQSLPQIKKIGDMSAHNRRYIARKNDIDSVKTDLRIVLEELIHIIDYKNWK